MNYLKKSNYVEENVKRMKEVDEEGDIKKLYIKNQTFDNAKDIFYGSRTPEVNLKLLDKKERNVIEPG